MAASKVSSFPASPTGSAAVRRISTEDQSGADWIASVPDPVVVRKYSLAAQRSVEQLARRRSGTS